MAKIERLTYNAGEAAECVGVSESTFHERVRKDPDWQRAPIEVSLYEKAEIRYLLPAIQDWLYKKAGYRPGG